MNGCMARCFNLREEGITSIIFQLCSKDATSQVQSIRLDEVSAVVAPP